MPPAGTQNILSISLCVLPLLLVEAFTSPTQDQEEGVQHEFNMEFALGLG